MQITDEEMLAEWKVFLSIEYKEFEQIQDPLFWKAKCKKCGTECSTLKDNMCCICLGSYAWCGSCWKKYEDFLNGNLPQKFAIK